MAKKLAPNQVRIYGRLSFVRVNKPEGFKNDSSNKRYSCSVIIEPGSSAEKEIKAAIVYAAEQQWGEKAKSILKSLEQTGKLCLFNGDSKIDIPEYAGMKVVSAGAQPSAPPSLVYTALNENGEPTNYSFTPEERENQTKIYAGCYANVRLDIWAQDNQYGKRVNAQLAGIQKVKDGDSLGGARPASTDEFEALPVDAQAAKEIGSVDNWDDEPETEDHSDNELF